ncbi:MAG: 1-acyl-sn-glycerol-3-phosphate acyltransferase [Leptolyngbyaceae cyanobacterium MO_188.B28]|nr:1-acyl-sn-glycerol-3-phosphate acyltransferase [Leptolyngbyaceae cyanobacterium MO_188.B28]
MSIRQPNLQVQQTTLPPITDALLKRVKEGLCAARDRAVRRSAQTALNQAEALVKSDKPPIVSGGLRRVVLRLLIHTLFRVKVEFPEHIPQGPTILAANHLNHIDPFLLLAELPSQPYYHILGDTRTLYNRWWKRKILGPSGGVIPLDRRWKEENAVIAAAKSGRQDLVELADAIEQDVPTGSDIHSMRQIGRIVRGVLARQDGIILFPEGRLGETEGHLHQPLKRGTVLYALRTGAPITPVALIGSQDLYLRKILTIRIGEPLYFPQSTRPKKQELEAALEKLQTALIALLPQHYQEPKGLKLFRNFLNHMFW